MVNFQAPVSLLIGHDLVVMFTVRFDWLKVCFSGASGGHDKIHGLS